MYLDRKVLPRYSLFQFNYQPKFVKKKKKYSAIYDLDCTPKCNFLDFWSGLYQAKRSDTGARYGAPNLKWRPGYTREKPLGSHFVSHGTIQCIVACGET